jgi:hypothetical protein
VAERKKKDPVKVAAGKLGGRPVTVDGRDRLTIRVSPEFHAKLRLAAERAKAEGREKVSVAQAVRLALELVMRDLDGRDLLKLLLEDTDQLEISVRQPSDRRERVAANVPAKGRRGPRPAGATGTG